MTTALIRFEAWLQVSRPEYLNQLNSGAQFNAIDELCSRFDVTLPDDFLAFLRWHDGQPVNAPTLYRNRSFMPIESVIDTVAVLNACTAAGEFPNHQWWDSCWLPFVADGAGNHLVIDLPNGCIREFWKADADRPIVAASFSEWLDQLVVMFTAQDWTEVRGEFLPAAEVTPAPPFEKVSVYMLRAAPGGLTQMKELYDRLRLSCGIGRLVSEIKTGPVLLLDGIYYSDACRLLSGLPPDVVTRCLEIRSAEVADRVYPATR